MLRLTREQIGILLGYIIGVVLLIAAAYGLTAFIAWEADPSNWSPTMRTVAVLVPFAIILFKLGIDRIQIVEVPDEEQR